jgi:hypothetical protein
LLGSFFPSTSTEIGGRSSQKSLAGKRAFRLSGIISAA